MEFKLEKKENSKSIVNFIIKESEFESEKEQALKELQKNLEVSGFRKGAVPLDIVRSKVKADDYYNTLLNYIYPKLVTEAITKNKLNPIIRPKLAVKKISDNEIEGGIVFVERPEITLSDYKKTAKSIKEEAPKVELIKPTDTKEDADKKAESAKKEKTKQDLERERLVKIYDELVKDTKIEIVEELKIEESNRMFTEFQNTLKQLKIDYKEYLKQQNKTTKQIIEEYDAIAEKNLKVDFILTEIAKKEKIEVKENEINEALKAQGAKDEDIKRLFEKRPQEKFYYEASLIKQKVVKLLLEQK